MSIFRSWPTVYLPDVGRKLPPLELLTSRGSEQIISSQTFRMYVCGITPYDSTHLGHAATYLSFDLINRYLRATGVSVDFVENITDIDEPLLERAHRDGVDWQELAGSQIDLFRSDMSALHILPPKDFVPATAVMDLIESAITQMQSRGYVYLVEQDLYFDISSFLDHLPIEPAQALSIFAERGGDPTRPGKRHPLDPVLWWANKNGEPGWESSHGFGRPGWHIECSVISLRYLLGEKYLDVRAGESAIDLQGGGSDLIFPHHFMSAAQSSAMLGIPFAHYLVHSGMVGLDGEKMSKSRGNLVFVSRLLEEKRDPVAIRYALLSDHYQADRMWNESLLLQAELKIDLIRLALAREDVPETDSLIDEIVIALSENLDTPRALKALENWAQGSSIVRSQHGTGELSRTLDALLGLAF